MRAYALSTGLKSLANPVEILRPEVRGDLRFDDRQARSFPESPLGRLRSLWHATRDMIS